MIQRIANADMVWVIELWVNDKKITIAYAGVPIFTINFAQMPIGRVWNRKICAEIAYGCETKGANRNPNYILRARKPKPNLAIFGL